MSETKLEREADDLDREMFMLSRRLEKFSEQTRDPAVDKASRIVFGLRGSVQKHMRRAALSRSPTSGE